MNVQKLIQEALENNEKVVIAAISPSELFIQEEPDSLSCVDNLMQTFLTNTPQKTAPIKLANIGFINNQAEVYFDNSFGLTIYHEDGLFGAIILEDGQYLNRDYAEFHDLDEDELNNLIQNLQNI